MAAVMADDYQQIKQKASNPWPRQYAEMTDVVADALGDRKAACRAIEALVRRFGGSYWYVPKGDALERLVRDQRIWHDYDGTVNGPNGIRAIARREQLSDICVHAIVAEQRRLHRMTLPDLFDGADN